MDSRDILAARTAIDADEIQRQIGALTDASLQRHQLERGTPEYDAALETEERLAAHVWRLATAIEPTGDTETPAARTDGQSLG